MTAAGRAGRERVNAFPIDGRYLFKHYFEGQSVFARLKRYYNNQQYRFEVPAEEFESIQSFLADHGYALIEIEPDAIDEYAVAVKQYTSHPENIFKRSVLQRSTDGYNCFLMTDRTAVEEAVDAGAMPVPATELTPVFTSTTDEKTP
ncbi:MAG: hypothetical protein ABEH65_08420 [Halobacteriales archaeon]